MGWIDSWQTPGLKYSGSPLLASGRGAGGEGRTVVEERIETLTLQHGRPPHPRPFSPAKPGEKGARFKGAETPDEFRYGVHGEVLV